MKISIFHHSFLLLTAAVLAQDMIYHEGLLAYYACKTVLSRTVYYFKPLYTDIAYLPASGGYCDKNMQQALGSMAHCLRLLPTEKGVAAFLDVCLQYNVSMQDFDASYENATQYLVANVSSYPGYSATKVFPLPVTVNQKTLGFAYKATLGRFYNNNRANFYGIALVSYWVLLICLAGIVRVFGLVAPRSVHSFNGKVSNFFRKHVTLAPLGKRKVVTHGKFWKVFEFVIPTRIETIYLVAWFAMVVAFNLSGYSHDSPNIYWPTKVQEMSRKAGERTGVIILYLIPQIVLFAGRNNFLQWVSGWRFARFNIIHRWMSRVALILMISHAVSMTKYMKNVGFYTTAVGMTFIRMGYVAVFSAAIMCFHSLAAIRKNNYEMFVLFHNVFGIVFIAAVWVHVKEEALQQFMYAAVAIWGFDKVLRLLRIFWFGVKTAEVQLLADETLRVKIPRPASWKPYPLCYAYIYFLRPYCFWQSHPFTVVDYLLEENTISFYIKVKGGMSSSVLQYLASQPENKALIKCTVEGPYGAGANLKAYSTVSYLSAGNGIPGLYSNAVKLAQKGTGQKLKLYWVVRHWKSIEWFYEELKALEGTTIEPVIYVTQYHAALETPFLKDSESMERSSDSSGTGVEAKAEKPESDENAERVRASLPFIEFRAGRPELDDIIKSDISESKDAVAFVLCGHDNFVDSARQIVLNNLEDGKRVDFFDTMEMW